MTIKQYAMVQSKSALSNPVAIWHVYWQAFKMWRQEVFPEAVLYWTSPINSFLQHISHNCGNSKDFVATKVANVATGTIWLDNAGLKSRVVLRKLFKVTDHKSHFFSFELQNYVADHVDQICLSKRYFAPSFNMIWDPIFFPRTNQRVLADFKWSADRSLGNTDLQ